jgi:hypothetical protein
MKLSENLFDPEPTPRMEREQRLRLFQQLHQSPEHEDMIYAELWRRANWFRMCEFCQLPYGEHPFFDEYLSGDPYMVPTDHRLCSGDVIHP